MPLTFDARRLLPEGIHDATLDEIERELAHSSKRRTLFDNLKEYVRGVRLTGWAVQVLIDGSFVMPLVAEPNDIDIILVMPEGWDMNRSDLKPYEYNTVNRRYTKLAYKIEVFPVMPDSNDYRSFFDLFTKIRIEWCRQFSLPEDARKGIVRLTL